MSGRVEAKLAALETENAVLAELVGAAGLVAIVLDRDLRIRHVFTGDPSALSVSSADVGRPLRDIGPASHDRDLIADAEHAAKALTVIERSVRFPDGRSYQRCIRSRPAAGDRPAGVMVVYRENPAHAATEPTTPPLAAALEVSEQRIRALLDATSDAIITIDSGGTIETFNAGAERMFGYSSKDALGRNVGMLMASPHRERHDEYLRRYRETRQPRLIGGARELKARHKDGSEFPIHLSVSEIDHGRRFMGIVRDITEQRALQDEIVKIATLEQRRIGEELHDNTQQELAGLGLLAEQLHESLQRASDGKASALAAKLAAGIAETNRRVSALAKGLVPVPVDAEGLMTALGELARTISDSNRVACRFECPQPVRVRDDSAALHLYRIAQEAVTNALKHADADTITIRLAATDREIALEITDNGVGIDEQPSVAKGLGLRIMAHRCSLLGGIFSVRPFRTGGTAVSCRVPTT